MAIKPSSIRALEARSLSEQEEARLDELECEIDLYLQTNFVVNDCPCFIVEDELSLIAKRELLRRYREVGWRVLALNGSEGITKLFFAEGSPSGLEPPERLSNTTH